MWFTILIIGLSFAWLLYETDFMRIRLKPYNYQEKQAVESNSRGIELESSSVAPIKEDTELYKPTIFMPLDMPALTGALNRGIMTTQIKVLRENIIKSLTSIKDDNVSIADVIINRKKLLSVLKLQTQADADLITLSYGNVSYQNIENEPCVQFNCNHTTFRFLNRPKQARYGQEPKIVPLNFIDYRESATQELTGIVIDSRELIKALSFVLPCVATEQSRPVLNCILFESGNNELKLVAADGFRLAVDTLSTPNIPEDKVLIQLKDISRLLTFLKSTKPIGKGKGKYYPDLYLSYNDKTIKFATKDGYIDLEKQDGTFPDYTQLIPTHGAHIELVASDMLQAVKAVSTMAKDGSGIVRLKFSKYPAKLILSARSEDLGNSSVECLAKVDRDCKIAVNGNYLIAYLAACKDSIIDLFITHESSPIVCHNGMEQL